MKTVYAQVVLMGVACLWLGVSVAQPTVAIQSTAAAVHTLTDMIMTYGRVRPAPQSVVAITADAGAYVNKIETSVGARVSKGDALLELRTAPAAREQFVIAKAQLTFAERALKSKRQLLADKLATHADVRSAQNTLAGARAAYETQKTLGNDQPLRTIRAPVSGVVSGLSVDAGQQVVAGTAMLQLASEHGLQAVLHVPASRHQQIQRGTPVVLTPVFGSDSTPLKAKVGAIGAVVDIASGQIDVRVPLSDTDTAQWLEGMAVSGRITLASRTMLAVPRSSVLSDKDGNYLFVVRNRIARRIAVKTTMESWGLLGVEGDLNADDRVVTQGNYELSDGAAVRSDS